MLNGTADIGIAQADAIHYFNKTNPNLVNKYTISLPIGEECIFIVARKDGELDTFQDFLNQPATIADGGPGSGSFATWDKLKTHNPEIKTIKTVPLGGIEAIAAVIAKKVDAFIFVTFEQYDLLVMSDIFRLSLNTPDLFFVPIDISQLLFNVSERFQTYHIKSIVIKKSFFDTRLRTACIESSIIISNHLSNKIKDSISKALIESFRRKDEF